jgi:hypothetical protein
MVSTVAITRLWLQITARFVLSLVGYGVVIQVLLQYDVDVLPLGDWSLQWGMLALGAHVGAVILLLRYYWFEPASETIKAHLAVPRSNASVLSAMLGCLFLGASFFLQRYITAQFGRLTVLDTIADIRRLPPTHFYALRHVVLDRQSIGVDSTWGGGKAGTYFIGRISIPFAGEPNGETPAAWLGVPFYVHKEFPDQAEGTVLDSLANAWRSSIRQTGADTLTTFVYLERALAIAGQAAFVVAASRSPAYRATDTEPLILYPVYTPFAQRADGLLWPVFVTIGLAAALVLGLLMSAESVQSVKQH